MAYTILYIAASADGFIADKNGGLDWLPQEASAGYDSGFDNFVASVDAIAQGARTFVHTLSFIESGLVPDLPYQGKHMYVFSYEPMTTDRTDVTFVHSIQEYLNILASKPEIKRVWLVGGAHLIASFKQHDLIDEIILTQIPTMLQEGIALPANLFDTMEKVEDKELYDGIIEKKYIKKY
jgi:dihydrofolate reductase